MSRLRDYQHYRVIATYAKRVHGTIYPNMPDAVEFTIGLLHGQSDALNENRIFKFIRSNDIEFPYRNVNEFLIAMLRAGILSTQYSNPPLGKGPQRLLGYVLSKDMLDLIEEQKPKQ